MNQQETSLPGAVPSSSTALAVVPTPKQVGEERFFWLLAMLLVFGILSQKVSVTVVPGTAIQIVLFMEYAFFGLCMLTSRLTIDPRRLVVLMAFFIMATIAAIMSNPAPTSLAYLFAVYLPFCLQIRFPQASYKRLIEVFQTLVLFACIWVMIDWLFQLVRLPMPDIELLIPKPFLFFNFNYIQVVAWGSKLMKPNGFFFLEVSYVAQLIATGLVIELCFTRRMFRILIYALCLLLTFSGTGFALVLMSLPFIITKLRVKLVFGAVLLLPLAAIVAVQVGVLENAEGRMEEFSRQGSSGNQRFTAQFEELAHNFERAPEVVMFGIGAGRMPQNGYIVWTPMTKVFVEYGIIAAAFFLVVLLSSVFRPNVPAVVSYALLMQFLFLNGGLLVPVNVFEMLFLTSLYKITDVGAAVRSAPAGLWGGLRPASLRPPGPA